RPCSRHDQPGGGYFPVHRIDEPLDAALHAAPLKSFADHVEVASPGLANDADGRRIAAPSQSRRRFRDGHINCVRTLRTANDQVPDAGCVNCGVINMEKLLSNRVTADESLLAEIRERR